MRSKYEDQHHLVNDEVVKTFTDKYPGESKGGGASTDMLPELLAESSKLKPEDQRIFFKGSNGDSGENNNVGVGSLGKEDEGNHKREREREREREKEREKKPRERDRRDDDKYEREARDEREPHDDFDSREDHMEDDHIRPPGEEKLTEEELMLQKLDMLRKLGELAQAGVTISQNYTLKSDLKMMKYEWELHKSIRAKQNAINWMSNMALNGIYGIEMLNESYNPFNLKLAGWAEQMGADADNYYDVFGELYDKYSHPTKGMAPELKLLLMLSGSAIKFHLSNTMMNSLPNLNDALDKDPEMLERLRREATKGKMKEASVKQNAALNSKMGKEHVIAAQKAADLKMIKEQEIEYLNAQKMVAEKKAHLEQLRKGFQNVNVVQEPVLKEPVIPAELSSILNGVTQQQQVEQQMLRQQLKQESQRRKEMEDQMFQMQKNMEEMKRSNDYKDKILKLSELERASDTRSMKSGMSQSVVSMNPNLTAIFRTKREALDDLAKDKEREKEKKKAAKLAEMSDKIVSMGTVDDVDVDVKDDGSFVSLGTKKSSKSASSKEGKAAAKKKPKNKGITLV
ncbi:MAG: hypothetical protein Harvfovirus10_12 [Harvfovirus sp.]|uniref:Uncharacterized protein n=1 Tax=Harvfovirus sp. TaxID=2487768 RepID=A0A3G5A336_9VIRU|nr:MAG: hypothetical protein Harvfovirus10_12 [Harvfovirus sp.]